MDKGLTHKRRDGTFGHSSLVGNDAQVVCNPNFSYGSYDIYRPDGIYAEKVMSFSTEEAALAYVREKGWDLVR